VAARSQGDEDCIQCLLNCRGYLETIFEGESDLAGQTRLDEVQESQKRIGGMVDMREGEQLTVRPPPPPHPQC